MANSIDLDADAPAPRRRAPPKRDSFLFRWWRTIDQRTLALAAVLMTVGLVLTFASSGTAAERLGLSNEYYFVTRQMMFTAAAATALLGLSFLGPVSARRAAMALYAVAIVLMVAVLFVGHEAKGAHRWLRFAGFSLQPSELMKPALIVVAAWLFARREQSPGFPAIPLALTLFALPVALLVMQPDVGQTGLLTLSFLVVFFVAGIPLVWIGALFCAALMGLAALYVAKPHVAERFEKYFNPDTNENYQSQRALDAIASGQVFGRGPGEGEIKRLLPDAHTDFIYSLASEEFGMIASLGIILLFAVLVVRGLLMASRHPDRFTQLACTGLFTLLGFQAAINLAVNLNLMPTKGMTLPFISYGGSSLLGTAITIGFALALSRRRPGGSLRV